MIVHSQGELLLVRWFFSKSNKMPWSFHAFTQININARLNIIKLSKTKNVGLPHIVNNGKQPHNGFGSKVIQEWISMVKEWITCKLYKRKVS